MGFLDRFRRTRRQEGGGASRAGRTADERHLAEFIRTRRGVEGFVEPQTAVSDVTLLLVAYDGEWTRRRVPSVSWAHQLCNREGIGSYDAGLVGIPQRMREWNRRQRQAQRELLRGTGGTPGPGSRGGPAGTGRDVDRRGTA